MKHQSQLLGGGISGSTIALQLAELGCNVTLLEKDAELLMDPMCHLHAGGNLYPELSDEMSALLFCKSVSIFARYYPATIDKRPTVLAISKTR